MSFPSATKSYILSVHTIRGGASIWMSAFYKAVLVRTLKGLIISGRAPNGLDGGDGDGGWEFF